MRNTRESQLGLVVESMTSEVDMAPLKLVSPLVDFETVDALTALLDDAKAGRIVGLAYIALHAGDRYAADLVGSVKEHRLLARGICRELEDTIAQ